jgi:hypothetical protein
MPSDQVPNLVTNDRFQSGIRLGDLHDACIHTDLPTDYCNGTWLATSEQNKLLACALSTLAIDAMH